MTEVFLMVRSVYPRDYRGSRDARAPRFEAIWIARGTGSTLYRSSPRSTRDEAIQLALAWLAKNPEYRDTTQHRSTETIQPTEGMMASKRQQHLPGIKPGIGHIEIVIPVMPMWEQVGGDMSPGAYGAILAKSDGNAIELLEIQPVREHVGDEEAKEIGFPFWSKEAYFDLDDLDPKKDDVQSALNSIGMSFETLEDDYTPEQRAMVIAEALLGWGRGDEGTSGWSKDVVPDQVKWWGGDVAGPEYLADEDETFKDDVLGYGEIKTTLEEEVERLADMSSAEAWSTAGDQMKSDLEDEGFDPESIVIFAEFGDEGAVNGDLTDDTVAGLETKLEADGYEYLDRFGGRVPSEEGFAHADTAIEAVAEELGVPEEQVKEAAESLDWWQEEIPRGTSGHTYVWAKRKAMGTQETQRPTMRAFNRELAGEYHTRTGKIGVKIYRSVDRNGRVTYSYNGEWGAGSGHDASYMQREVRNWLERKRGIKTIIPFQP